VRLRIVTVVAAAIATAIGLYMTWLRHQGDIAPCLAGGGGCSKVSESAYAEVFGLPVSALGAVGGALVLACAWSSSPRVRALGAAVALGGAAFSLYLTVVELWVIDAICQWCVASAVCWCTLGLVEAVRFLRLSGGATGPPEEHQLRAVARD
jgi:uncharacterized membrane protein